MFGRNGEAPVPIVAPRSPGDCFDAAIEAARIALTYRTPVFLLSDGYLANGSEPWRMPDGRRPARPPGRVRHRAQRHRREAASSCPTCATPRRSPVRGRCPGTAGSGAPHRRHREGRRHRQHLLRPGQPRLHGPHPAGEGRRHRRIDRRPRGRRPRRRRAGAGARLGLHLRPDRRRVPSGARAPAASSRRRTCATSTRSRPTSARCSRLRQGGDPGDEPRPARHC